MNVRLGPSGILIDRRAAGVIYARSPHPLGTYPERVTDLLDHWAAHASYRTFLAEKHPITGWRNVTYAETQFFAWRIGQALVNRDLSVERPVVILSRQGIDHILLALGATYAGVPYAPVETTDPTEQRAIFDLLNPGLVLASHDVPHADPADAEVVFRVSELVDTPTAPSIAEAYARVHANTVFKIGPPHGAINTHRMWASNQEMAKSCFAFLADEPPVFSGSVDVGLVLYTGGSLYLDQGKPAPGHIAPTMYFDTPKGFEALVPSLRNEPEFRKRFLSRLKLMYCAGPGLSKQIMNDLSEIPVPLITGLGSETVPHGLFAGYPAPEVELKLVPSAPNVFEARIRGPNVTLGYWRRPALTKAAFDEEGFLKLGVNLRLVEEENPSKGFAFV